MRLERLLWENRMMKRALCAVAVVGTIGICGLLNHRSEIVGYQELELSHTLHCRNAVFRYSLAYGANQLVWPMDLQDACQMPMSKNLEEWTRQYKASYESADIDGKEFFF